MAVDGCPEVVHHRLPDEVREERRKHHADLGDDRNGDHPGDEPDQELQVDGRHAVRADLDRVVEHVPQEERWDDAQSRREEDQAAGFGKPHLVRREEPDDAAEVRLADSGVFRALYRPIRGAEAVEAIAGHSLRTVAAGRSRAGREGRSYLNLPLRRRTVRVAGSARRWLPRSRACKAGKGRRPGQGALGALSARRAR